MCIVECQHHVGLQTRSWEGYIIADGGPSTLGASTSTQDGLRKRYVGISGSNKLVGALEIQQVSLRIRAFSLTTLLASSQPSWMAGWTFSYQQCEIYPSFILQLSHAVSSDLAAVYSSALMMCLPAAAPIAAHHVIECVALCRRRTASSVDLAASRSWRHNVEQRTVRSLYSVAAAAAYIKRGDFACHSV